MFTEDDVQPTQRLVSSSKSLIDTVFSDKKTNLPAFATLTRDGCTELWQFDIAGVLEEVGRIYWDGSSKGLGSSGTGDHLLTLRGQQRRFGQTVKRSKTLLGGGYLLFTMPGTTQTVKWKQVDLGKFTDMVQTWSCTSLPVPSDPSPPSPPSSFPSFASFARRPSLSRSRPSSSGSGNASLSTDTKPSLLATLSPPLPRISTHELAIYAPARLIVADILFSVIALTAPRTEFVKLSSIHTKETLERSLAPHFASSRIPANSVASMNIGSTATITPPPPYQGRRVRRPRTAGAETGRRPGAFPQPQDIEPPPYASRIDVSNSTA